jgi:hypothetical protein
MDFDTNDSVNPDVEDLLQEDQGGSPHALVRHVGPINAHVLPARLAHSRSIRVTDSASPANLEIIASEDQRRQYVAIICTEQAIFVGHDKQMVADGLSGILPPGIPLYLPTTAEIWVRSFDPAGSQVSYWVGQWAD